MEYFVVPELSMWSLNWWGTFDNFISIFLALNYEAELKNFSYFFEV